MRGREGGLGRERGKRMREGRREGKREGGKEGGHSFKMGAANVGVVSPGVSSNTASTIRTLFSGGFLS